MTKVRKCVFDALSSLATTPPTRLKDTLNYSP